MNREKKKILFLNPPNPFLINPSSAPRLGVLYLATILKQQGHEVTVYHLHTLAELQEIVKIQVDYIGISATTREYPDALQILNYFKRENHHALIIIGGPHATALPEECLRNGFDFVVTGEADEYIVQLIEQPHECPKIIHAGFVENLNALSFPNRNLLGSPDAWQPFMGLRQSPLQTTTMILSRGCPYRCSFCGPHFIYRRRSDENIAAELSTMADAGYQGLILLDDLPFLNEQHVRHFCETIQPLNMHFRCNLRADLLTPTIAKLLAEAGCCRLQFGIESASQLVLNRIQKGDTTRNGEAIRICKEYGIESKAMCMFGLPGDDLESAKQLVKWVAFYRPNSIQVSRFIPLPGSPFWQEEYHSQVTDYTSLSFFPNSFFSINETDKHDQVSHTINWILSQCQEFTHIDSGAFAQEINENVKKENTNVT